MDFKSSNCKNQSRISYSKSPKIYLIILSLVGLTFGCSSKSQKAEDVVYFDSLEGEIHQLSKVGENSEAYFSPLSNRLLMVRDNPKEHKTPQIYEKNLVNKTEKRITYNLGENHNPQYHPLKSWIIYSSSADELIEKVDVRPTMKDLGMKVPEETATESPQDVYISSDDGSDIKRITREKGFDGLPTFSRDGDKVYYVRREKAQSQILEFNLKSASKKVIHSEKTKILSLSVSEKFIAWTYKNDDSNEKLIVKELGKGNKTVYEGNEKNFYSDVELHPKEMRLLVASNLEDPANKDIYQIDFGEKCATRFSFHGAEESHPTFGPEGTSLFFVSNRSKVNQIYATLIRPQLACKPLQ